MSFRKKAFTRFDGRKYERTVVEVLPADAAATPATKAPAKKTTKKAEKKVPTAKKEVAPKKSPAKKTDTKAPKKADSGADDLTKIEGIGPKIASVFADNGVKTFDDLSASKV